MTKKEKIEKFIFLGLGAAVLALVALPLFKPVVIGLSMACAAWGMRDRIQKKLNCRRTTALVLVPIASLVTIFGVIAFAGFRIASFVQMIQDELKEEPLKESINKMSETSQANWVSEVLQNLGVSTAQMRPMFQETLKNTAKFLATPVKDFLNSIPELAVALVLFLVTFWYIYFYQDSLRKSFLKQKLISHEAGTLIGQSFCEFSYTTYVAAGITSLAQGLVVLVGGLLSGVPQAAIWAFFAILLSFFPYVGTIPISVAMVATLAFTDASSTSVIVMAIFGVAAGLIDNIIRPYLLRSGADLHPWLGFVSVFGGLYLWGLAGIFIGPVLVGVAAVVVGAYLPQHTNAQT